MKLINLILNHCFTLLIMLQEKTYVVHIIIYTCTKYANNNIDFEEGERKT